MRKILDCSHPQVSGQCLSPSGGGHALTPPRHLSPGEPLPHQQANTTQAAPLAESHLCCRIITTQQIIGYYSQFPVAIPDQRVHTYALLPRLPLSSASFTRRIIQQILARLACLIHAANVHSEPGSNPSSDCLPRRSKLRRSLVAQKCLTHASVARWTHSKFSRPPRTSTTATEVTAVYKANSYLGFSTKLSKNTRRLRQRRCRREVGLLPGPIWVSRSPNASFPEICLVGDRPVIRAEKTVFSLFGFARKSRNSQIVDHSGSANAHSRQRAAALNCPGRNCRP